MTTKPHNVILPVTCKGCNRSGTHALGDRRRARWCRCRGGSFGPYNAPEGSVSVFVVMSADAKADLDAARAIRNEWWSAREAGSDARWTPSLRRRPRTSSVYRAWEKRMRAAQRALDKLRAECAHEHRAIPFSREHCERCWAHLGPRAA